MLIPVQPTGGPPMSDLFGGVELGRLCEVCRTAPGRSHNLPGRIPIPGWMWCCPRCWRDVSRPPRAIGVVSEYDLDE